MGNKVDIFSESQFEDYQDCTFLTRKEIIDVFKRFREINPDEVPKRMSRTDAETIILPVESIESIRELRENPFKRRICQVFSSDGKGNMSFDDFLEMMSVLSAATPRDIKLYYAFRIYDLDGDELLGPKDLRDVANLLTRGGLAEEELDQIVEKIIEEADIDGDGSLSFMDFEHVVARAPDFLSNFHLRI